MTVITMTREMGSLGKDVATGVAESMGLEIIHHEVLERDVAGKMNLGESDVHRFLEGKQSLLDRWKIDQKKLSHYTAEEIYDFATNDNVLIRGWGATSLLRRVPHVIKIRVCAPMSFRVKILQERLNMEDGALARREIERNDAAHTRSLRGLVNSDWEGPLNYDMVLNTERIPIDDCVKQVISLAKSSAFAPTAQSRQTLIDLAIESRVRTILAGISLSGMTSQSVDLSVRAGELVVSGVVDNKERGETLCSQLRSAKGVKSVTNNLIVLHAYRG